MKIIIRLIGLSFILYIVLFFLDHLNNYDTIQMGYKSAFNY